MTTRWLAVGALLATALAWGASFVVTKGAFDHVSALGVASARLILSGLVLTLVFSRSLRSADRAETVWGLGLGLLFALALTAQTLGLQLIAPSMSGFLTATYVLFTAGIVTIAFGQRQPSTTWLAVALMVTGISVLACAQGGEATNVIAGAAVTILSALLFAFHIVFLGRRVHRRNVAHLTVMQALSGAALGLAIWPFLGEPIPTSLVTWAPLLYLGVVCGAVALLMQSWAQSIVPATPAAVIMCSEPVWAATFAVALGFEPLTIALIVGGSLVVGGVLFAVIPGRTRRRAEDVVDDVIQGAPARTPSEEPPRV